MKVLLINGGPNAKGCTYTALTEVEKTLNEAGVDTEIIHVGNKDLRGCIGCRYCKKNGKCVFNVMKSINTSQYQICQSYQVNTGTAFMALLRRMYTQMRRAVRSCVR